MCIHPVGRHGRNPGLCPFLDAKLHTSAHLLPYHHVLDIKHQRRCHKSWFQFYERSGSAHRCVIIFDEELPLGVASRSGSSPEV